MTEHALSRNPTTGEILARYPLQNSAELEQTLTESASAFAAWKRSTMTDRVRVLRQLGEQIRLREQDLSRMITLEMGKPIAQGTR
ncbi:Succinate semialdehyde dehydrogenase [NAD(P)+] Sad [Pantoea agglomerans]|uniref:Succinate semialdehyde dehydrogenase [NAD(P)+] Sad n=1 Tax=Enterobacter agglomerans TaxID=549 RepID=A0A379LRT1_ENTAG|nr:Succinate semialdehyde dehydrogenase [NAD(P)+] Sad [Pantoea agglomerans]